MLDLVGITHVRLLGEGGGGGGRGEGGGGGGGGGRGWGIFSVLDIVFFFYF